MSMQVISLQTLNDVKHHIENVYKEKWVFKSLGVSVTEDLENIKTESWVLVLNISLVRHFPIKTMLPHLTYPVAYNLRVTLNRNHRSIEEIIHTVECYLDSFEDKTKLQDKYAEVYEKVESIIGKKDLNIVVTKSNEIIVC